MSTILTDDEIATAIAHLYAGPEVLAMALPDELHSARAVEAAVLAKLAQQWPVGFIHPQAVSRLENGETVAFRKVPYIGERQIPVFLRPVPPQADRQRVPDGWKLVPVVPTSKMLGAADREHAARDLVSIALISYQAMLTAAPEAPVQTDDLNINPVTLGRTPWAYGEAPANTRNPGDLAASAVDEREKELKWLCAEAYQVVASMLNDLGAMETEKANKILDNLSQARFVHDDVLPWPALAQKGSK